MEVDGSKDSPQSVSTDTVSQLLAELRAACDVSPIVATYFVGPRTMSSLPPFFEILWIFSVLGQEVWSIVWTLNPRTLFLYDQNLRQSALWFFYGSSVKISSLGLKNKVEIPGGSSCYRCGGKGISRKTMEYISLRGCHPRYRSVPKVS